LIDVLSSSQVFLPLFIAMDVQDIVLFQFYIDLFIFHRDAPLLLLWMSGSLTLIRNQCANTVSISNDIVNTIG